LFIVVAMWDVSCPLQEGIGEKPGEKKPEKISIPIGEADADEKGC
jgi:hypothetical protein